MMNIHGVTQPFSDANNPRQDQITLAKNDPAPNKYSQVAELTQYVPTFFILFSPILFYFIPILLDFISIFWPTQGNPFPALSQPCRASVHPLYSHCTATAIILFI
jgi:hypothetical protein